MLDPTHCGGLEEGDRLVAIDGIDLRDLSHTQVVQVLKDFPLGKEAALTIQRIHSQPLYNQNMSPGKIFSYKCFLQLLCVVNCVLSNNLPVPPNHYSESRLISNHPAVSPRSKTPTAEFDRSRVRLRDSLPERSKLRW